MDEPDQDWRSAGKYSLERTPSCLSTWNFQIKTKLKTITATNSRNISDVSLDFVLALKKQRTPSLLFGWIIIHNNAPVVNAGIDLSSCENNPTTVLSGFVSGATTTGVWSGGLGTYNPSNSVLNSVYTPNPSEIAAGSVTLLLTSTNNGNCIQVVDSVVINFSNAPTVNAGIDLFSCKLT